MRAFHRSEFPFADWLPAIMTDRILVSGPVVFFDNNDPGAFCCSAHLLNSSRLDGAAITLGPAGSSAARTDRQA